MKILSRSEIDPARWDAAVKSHPEFRHYYFSYYLDAAAENWKALISDDYELIWPLPFKSVPIKRVYQPIFTQQLGPLMKTWNEDLFQSAFSLVKDHFAVGRLKLHNRVPGEWLANTITHRNIELNLRDSAEVSAAAFNRNVRSNLRKFEKSGAEIAIDKVEAKQVIELFRSQKGQNIKEADADFYERLQCIFDNFHERGEATTWCALGQNCDLLAGVLLLNTQGRLLNLLSVSGENGRNTGAVHAIFAHIIRGFSGKATCLDFEGSNDDNLAFFYRSFGGNETLYLQAEWSRLPWPLNRFK